MAYATVADLESRWRTLTAEEQEKAATLLEDAADVIDSEVTIDADDEVMVKRAGRISCDMVRRAMSAQDSELYGVTQASATMGPFSQQATYANATGELYLSRSEKSQLGANSTFIDSLRPKVGGWHACS